MQRAPHSLSLPPSQLWRGDVEALLLGALGGPDTSASCSVTFLGVKLTGTNF